MYQLLNNIPKLMLEVFEDIYNMEHTDLVFGTFQYVLEITWYKLVGHKSVIIIKVIPNGMSSNFRLTRAVFPLIFVILGLQCHAMKK